MSLSSSHLLHAAIIIMQAVSHQVFMIWKWVSMSIFTMMTASHAKWDKCVCKVSTINQAGDIWAMTISCILSLISSPWFLPKDGPISCITVKTVYPVWQQLSFTAFVSTWWLTSWFLCSLVSDHDMEAYQHSLTWYSCHYKFIWKCERRYASQCFRSWQESSIAAYKGYCR